MRLRWMDGAIALGLLLLALGVRVYRLSEIPFGLHSDEAANGLDALNVLAGQHAIFFERNFGREPLLIYLQAAAMGLLGTDAYSLRIAAALVGAITIPVIYWLVLEMYRDSERAARWIAIYVALFVTFSYWHLSLSRIGYRAICLPLFATLAFCFFWRAWRELRQGEKVPWRDAVLCGVFVGGSLYTYTAARLLPVLFMVVVLVGMFINRATLDFRRVGRTVLWTVAAAWITFVPLGYYFVQHPETFFDRAMEVALFSPEDESQHPVRMLAENVWTTAAMFGAVADPNLRHNPAGRPVFDAPLGIGLALGILMVVVRRRRFAEMALLAWTLIFALPAILSAEGVPHSLRAIGMIPAVYILPTVAIIAAGRFVLPKRRQLALWLPIPLLVYSAVTGVHAYFSAWEETPNRLALVFEQHHIDIAAQMTHAGTQGDVWLIPLSPHYSSPNRSLYTVEFFYDGQADIYGVVLDRGTLAEQLRVATRDKQRALVLRPADVVGYGNALFVFGDPKNLLSFVMEKYARPIESSAGTRVPLAENRLTENRMPENSAPYTLYELSPQATYEVREDFSAVSINFDDQVALTGAAYGEILPWGPARANDVPADALTARADQSTWIVLRWMSQSPIETDLKVRLDLKDSAGYPVGQADHLLVGDGYPEQRIWARGTETVSYHILPIEPGTPPGLYGLYARVYADGTGEEYPVRGSAGEIRGFEARVGTVSIARLAGIAAVNPATRVDETMIEETASREGGPAAAIRLLGYDVLGERTVSPGGSVPLVFYWQAVEGSPMVAYDVRVTVEGPGQAPLQWEAQPVYGSHPAPMWHPGEIVRDRHAVPIPVTMADGNYDVSVVLVDGDAVGAQIDLGQITIAGRPRVFDAPISDVGLFARYGNYVRLTSVGLRGLEPHSDTDSESASDQTMRISVAASDPIEVFPIVFDLNWQVISSPEEPLVRFVHMMDQDGNLVAQQDVQPCDGECPADTWYPGEYLVDPVYLDRPGDRTPGRYSLGVGWYVPHTFERVPVFDGEGNRLVNDLYVLPLVIEVEE